MGKELRDNRPLALFVVTVVLREIFQDFRVGPLRDAPQVPVGA
jgi:hypothetical protein